MDAYICDAQRTPIGRFGGALAQVRADDLAAVPIAALMARNPDVDWSRVDDVILPHIAEVGLVPGTEHFRNIQRHEVLICPSVLTIRVDESLYFANARYLEDFVYDRVQAARRRSSMSC